MILLMTSMACIPGRTLAQQGTIYWRNGTTSEVDSFTEISIQLVYYWWNKHQGTGNRGEFFRNIPPEQLSEIEFVRQSAQGTAGFYYRVTIRGFDREGNKIDENIPTWDWIDMSLPGKNGRNSSKVTFFHRKRRISITKITFPGTTAE